MTHIDPATVQQCIDALTKLLPAPEQTESERLVDEWLSSSNPNAGYKELAQFILDKQKPVEMVISGVTSRETAERMAYRELKSMIASPDAGPIVEKPGLVYGPWIGAEDDKTPDFPVGWSYQMRNALTGEVNQNLMQMVKRHPSQNTEYRAVFTVGKWYNWNKVGECPLPADTLIQWLWGDETEFDFDTDTYEAGGLSWSWQNPDYTYKIKKFRIVGETQ